MPACPVCGSAERTVLHKELIDNVFFVAPGKWTLHSCTQCKSAYLDPRPNPANIGKAYGTYYTHVIGTLRDNAAQLGVFRRLRRMMSNGYRNRRYGTQRQPASALGQWVAMLLPVQRQELDTEFRYLPKPTQGQRLLDIGCGNGSFLINAREAGWQVTGVEPDPKAADAARQRGVNVTVGTIDLLAGESNCFDAITLSHVIEHVYEPKQLLQDIYRLLKSGGVFYIETPNIASHWAKLFGKNWRGIETPRHLVLFTPNSLKNLLLSSGFCDIKMEYRSAPQKHMYISSSHMAAGRSPYSSDVVKLRWLERTKYQLSLFQNKNFEFITLTVSKRNIDRNSNAVID